MRWVGTSGDDFHSDTNGDNELEGGAGNDTIYGLGGNDNFYVTGTFSGFDYYYGDSGFNRIVCETSQSNIYLRGLFSYSNINEIIGFSGFLTTKI